MTDIDPDLDARLRAAGTLLDDLADRRAAAAAPGRRARTGRIGAGRPLAIAAVVAFAVLAVGLALVVRDAGSDGSGPHATRPGPTDPAGPEDVESGGLRAGGATGLIATTERGLVDLGTRAVTPMDGPAGPYTSQNPIAIPSPDGRLVYYESWDRPEWDGTGTEDAVGTVDGRPSIRALDVDSETNRAVADGALSFAVSGTDSSVAYVDLVDPVVRHSVRFTGDVVVVRGGPDGEREVWTDEPGRYGVVAWAGDRLLVAQSVPDTEATDLLVFDGPGPGRLLGQHATLVAVGPQGDWALVQRSVGDLDDDGESELVVIDLATGAATPVVLDGAPRFAGRATWDGDDRLVVPSVDGVTPVLVDLAVTPGPPVAITVRHVTRLDPTRTFAPHEAWVAADGTTLVALARAVDPSGGDGGVNRVVTCTDDACSDADLPEESGAIGHVHNPSRPLPG